MEIKLEGARAALAVRAVQTTPSSIDGFVRISARTNPTAQAIPRCVTGFLLPFKIDLSEGHLYLKEDVFFYGSRRDLESNYHGRVPESVLGNVHDFRIRRILRTIQTYDTWQIPFSSMGMVEPKLGLAVAGIEGAVDNIDGVVHGLMRRGFNSGAPQSFRNYPGDMYEIAEHSGFFYSESGRSGTVVEIPKLQIVKAELPTF